MAAPISVIKYEGPNTVFVYKHPTEDFNKGSQLIVHESQEAIFMMNGEAMDRFGAGKYTLETESLPILHRLHDALASGPSQFHSEVYFVNLTTQMGIKWGTDTKVRMFDPASGLHIELGAYGEFNLKVIDAAKVLVKIVGTELVLNQEQIMGSVGYSNTALTGKFRALVMTKVKSILPKIIRESGYDILEIDEHLEELSLAMCADINKVLREYGFEMPEFFITAIETPDDDPAFKKLKAQFAERTLGVRAEKIKKATAEAQNERMATEATGQAQVKRIQAQGDADAAAILAAGEAARIRAEGLAEADVMRAKGYTYQQETQREIGVAAASNENGGGAASGIAATMVQAGVGIGTAVAIAKGTSSAMAGALNPDGTPVPAAPAPSAKWVCPSCGHETEGKFCSECGAKKPEAPAVEKWVCSHCGHENDGKFCSECGTKKGE